MRPLNTLLASAVLLSSTAFAATAVASDSERPTITDIVASSGGEFDRNWFDYDILLTAVLAAGLEDTLADPVAAFTVFAPNDLGFIRLARDLGYKVRSEADAWNAIVEVLTDLGDGDPIPVLTDILLYHVVPEKISVFGFVQAVVSGDPIVTALGPTIDPFFFGLVDNDPDFRNPRLTFPINVLGSNGIIHTINRVLIPVDL